jgi:hypothetical protein
MRWVGVAVISTLVVVVVALIAVIAASGGGDDNPTPTPTPILPTATPTPTPPGQTPSPTPEPPESAYRLVYREFGETEDVIWATDPANPEDREELARIEHREGFGIKPSLSPDGKTLAYLSLPDYALSAQSSQAELYIRDLETEDTVLLAENVDLMFAPLWTPDGKLLYVRQYAGPEFLSADVMITRVRVLEIGKDTPTPTPSPPPSQTPSPTQEPNHVILRDSVAHVLNFIPVGFSDDGESLFFVQIQGGTEQGSLLGLYRPATTEGIDAAWQMYLDALAEADEINNADPTPSATVTPRPTPTADARLVVAMSDQAAYSYDLSEDSHQFSYVIQEFGEDGDIVSRTYVADIIEASVSPISFDGLPEGYHLNPIWRPGDGRLTIGVLPTGGTPSGLILVSPEGTELELLPTRSSGFDEPRSWSPDGQWLAVEHSEGTSLTNRHDVKLEVLALNGFRTTIIAGADNATVDSVIGWIAVGEDE